MNSKHLLLVEDDSHDAELTLAALKDLDMAKKVYVVRDGAEALDYLYCRGKFHMRTTGNPILVLLDNKMPKVTGLEALMTIKSEACLRMIPVVALTSSRETSDLIEFYRYGVNAYVVKPVDFSEFMTTVRQLAHFWISINEPPPQMWKGEASNRPVAVISPATKVDIK